jgi:hypothetical protein
MIFFVFSRTFLTFYILLTVQHLDVILVNDQLYALFSMYLFHASTCFEQQVLIIRRTNLCQHIIWYNTLWWVTDVPVFCTRINKERRKNETKTKCEKGHCRF